MAKRVLASLLEVESNTDDDIDIDSEEHLEEIDNNDKEDSEGHIDDDSDDEDYNPQQETKKRKMTDQLEEDPITAAMQKCQQLTLHMRDVLKSIFAASRNQPIKHAYEDMKFVMKSDVNRACGIAENDATRELRLYQITGINFLLFLHRLDVGGAILADEMGLGKTIQVIAFLGVLKSIDNNPGPHLVVAPVSVLENWKQEFEKWCPFFTVVVYHGKSKEVFSKKVSNSSEKGGPTPFHILITSYSVFEGETTRFKEDRRFLKSWNWDCVIMDEGHFLKASTSKRNKKLQDIACVAKQRIMLTGTPVQNDLKELWSLLSFLMPCMFDIYGKNLDQIFGVRNHNEQDQQSITKMRTLLKPFVMRRTKSEAEWKLQSKTHCLQIVEMLDNQRGEYKKVVKLWQNIPKSKDIKGNSLDESYLSKTLAHQEISNVFAELRKISNHPLLVRRIYKSDKVRELAPVFKGLGVFGNQCTEDQVYEKLLSYSDFELHKLCEKTGQQKLDNEHFFSSAKSQMLAQLLPKLKEEGHRCLIFSQWTKILDILEHILTIKGYTFVRIDGSTNRETRQDLVDKYNKDSTIFIFLISTRAGGQGLNLTGADTIIIHDVDFNPQMDRQAEARCHRIGQQKSVTIYRFVTKDSVEQRMYDIAEEKLNLDAAMLQPRGSSNDNNLKQTKRGSPDNDHPQTKRQIMLEYLSSSLLETSKVK